MEMEGRERETGGIAGWRDEGGKREKRRRQEDVCRMLSIYIVQ